MHKLLKGSFKIQTMGVEYTTGENTEHGGSGSELEAASSWSWGMPRECELVVHRGGEEIVVLCSEPECRSPWELADRIHLVIEAEKVLLLDSTEDTVNAGAADPRLELADADALLDAAGCAMYGGNRVRRGLIRMTREHLVGSA